MVNIPELAHQVLDVCASLKPGERVWVNSWDHTLDLASQLAWECEKRGCPAVVTVQTGDLWLRSLVEAPRELIDGIQPQQAALLEETDVYIYTLGPSKPIPWEKVPEDRHNLVTWWFFEKNKFVEEWKAIARRRKVRMLGIEATLATPERANVLGLDFEAWKQVMFEGCMADYREVERRVSSLLPIMSGEGDARITTPSGTDFKFRLDKRPVDFSAGMATPDKVEKGRVVFLPAGGAEVSADEESGEGTVVYDVPIHNRDGLIDQLSLELEKGRITHFSSQTWSEIFERYLTKGKGDVDRFAFFGFGLNPKLRFGFTQDDKVLGGVTVGFGDNEGKGGKNRAEGDHWWACLSKATVRIDGRMIMENGRLLA